MSSDPKSDNPKEFQEITESKSEPTVKSDENSLKKPSADNDVHNDFQVIETELNQHIKEAGLFYQSLGDSLRRMESAHKKIYQQHQTASTKIQQLKNKATKAEDELKTYKIKFHSILTLCFILIIVIVALMSYKQGNSNTNNQGYGFFKKKPNEQNKIPDDNTSTQYNSTDSNSEIINKKSSPIHTEKEIPTITPPPIKENETKKEENLEKPTIEKELKESPEVNEKKQPESNQKTKTNTIKKPLLEKILPTEKTEDISPKIQPDKTKESSVETINSKESKKEEPIKKNENETIEKSETVETKISEKEKKANAKKRKKEKKAKERVLKGCWSDYHKAIRKAKINLAKEKLQKIILLDPEDELAISLLKKLNEPLPVTPEGDSKD